MQSDSIKEMWEIFPDEFPGVGLPAKRCIQNLLKKW